jgi:ADP-L-glycero-D-manno-heptose 6-epimerase
VRDFVWVGDCVAVMLWLLDQPKVSGLFNVGSGKARSFADLAKAVYDAAGTKPMIAFREMPETMRDKYQYFTEADLTKLRAAGFMLPTTSLEDGVRWYVKYLASEDRYV